MVLCLEQAIFIGFVTLCRGINYLLQWCNAPIQKRHPVLLSSDVTGDSPDGVNVLPGVDNGLDIVRRYIHEGGTDQP